MKTYKSSSVECDINIVVMSLATRMFNVRRRRVQNRAQRQIMISIFLVLFFLVDFSVCQNEFGYNNLQDPAKWTQPSEEEGISERFTPQDFSRHSPEIVKLRQKYVQTLWEQILQLQKDFPTEDSESENVMPWLWEALRDKFNSGGMPSFDFDGTLPRLAGRVLSEVNMKTITEILQDLYRQSMNPGNDFYEDISRNLYLFNVYYDNKRNSLEEQAGRLLKFLYIQNKGCFKNPGELAQHFKQPITKAYQNYNFTPEELQTLMFNIEHIFEGFNHLKENLAVLDTIARRILSKLHQRLQDPRKEELYHSIVRLFSKYGPTFNDPRNMEGSWPSLVIDLLAAICRTPDDLFNFIQSIGNLFRHRDSSGNIINNNGKVSQFEEPQENNEIESQIVSKRIVPPKIRRKAPVLGFSNEFKDEKNTLANSPVGTGVDKQNEYSKIPSASFVSASQIPGAHMKKFKKRFGDKEDDLSSKVKNNAEKKTSSRAARTAAYKRQLNALQQLQAARAQLLDTQATAKNMEDNAYAEADEQLVAALGGDGKEHVPLPKRPLPTPAPAPALAPVPVRRRPQATAAESNEYQADHESLEAERANTRELIAKRERLAALQAERNTEISEEDEDFEEKKKSASSKKSGDEEGYEKEYEEKTSPFGTSKGKIKAYKKSSSTESTESSSVVKKKTNKKNAKVNEKLATLNKEIEDLQEMLSSKERVLASKSSLRGKHNRLTTMSGSLDDETKDTALYKKYRELLDKKLKQRAKLIELKEKLNKEDEEDLTDKAFRSAFSPFRPQLMTGAYPTPRRNPMYNAQSAYANMYAKKLQADNYNRLKHLGAPLLGLGPYAVPQSSGFNNRNPSLRRVANNPYSAQNVRREFPQNNFASRNNERLANRNVYYNPLATFRSAAGTKKGYHRKFGGEENKSSSKTRVRQKKNKQKNNQKLATARGMAEAFSQQQNTEEQLKAKAAENRKFSNKVKNGKNIDMGDRISASSEKNLAELLASINEVKKKKGAKAEIEAAILENNDEDENSDLEVEKSSSSSSATHFGEESSYSTEYDNLAKFRSAKSGPEGRTVGYTKQFGTVDNTAKTAKRIGDKVTGGEVAQHASESSGQLFGLNNTPMFRRLAQPYGLPQNRFFPKRVPNYGYLQAQYFQPAQNQPVFPSVYNVRPTFMEAQPKTQLNFRGGVQGEGENPLPVGTAQESNFMNRGGYHRVLPNGHKTGYQNQYGQFGTFQSALSAPGKFGKVKGFKKKYGSETAEESSSLKMKNRNKSSQKAGGLMASEADTSELAEIGKSNEKLFAKQNKNKGINNIFNNKGEARLENLATKNMQAVLQTAQDQMNTRLLEQAKSEAIQAQATSEDKDSETEIEQNKSKKSAKHFGEESGYENNFGNLGQFQSTLSNHPEHSFQGFPTQKAYLDNLVNFRNARQSQINRILPNVAVRPNQVPVPYYMMAPSAEVQTYKKKFDSESEEMSSKSKEKERQRTQTERAKMSITRGKLDETREEEKSSDEKIALNTAVDAYRNKANGAVAPSEGVKKKFGLFGERRDELKAKLKQRAKLYSLENEVLQTMSEREKEREKSTHEKKEKMGGEESGFQQKFKNIPGIGPYRGLSGQSKGMNKNFSKETSEKTSNLKEKSRQKTALLISKITEVQRELDVLREFQASLHRRIAATGEVEAYQNPSGQAVKTQNAVSVQMKQIVKRKQLLRMKMQELRKTLAIHQQETEKEIEKSSSENTSKNTGEESSFEHEYGGGDAADGNVVTGTSSGYSKSTSTQSSKKSQNFYQYGKMKDFGQASNVAVNNEALTRQDELQSDIEKNLAFRQMAKAEAAPPVPVAAAAAAALPSIAPIVPVPPNFNEVPNFQFPMVDNDMLHFGSYVPPVDFMTNPADRLPKRGFQPGFGQPMIAEERNPFSAGLGNIFSSSFQAPSVDDKTNTNLFGRSFRLPGFGAAPRTTIGPTANSGAGQVNNFIQNQQKTFGDKLQSVGMNGTLSGIHREMNLDGGNFATNTREKSRLMSGIQNQIGVGDKDFFQKATNYAGRDSVSRSPTLSKVSQELSARSQGVSANSLGFSENKLSSSSKIFTG